MRKRKRSVSDTTKSRSRSSPRSRRRVVQKQPANAERRVYTQQGISRRVIRRGRDSLGEGTDRSGVSRPRSPDRRASLLAQKRAKKGLPKPVLQMAVPNAIAHRKKMPATPCARRKTERRAVLIAKGFGGINKVRNYREHRKCR